LKLNYTYNDIQDITKGKVLVHECNSSIQSVAFDTRKIADGNSVLFFALTGEFRNGHAFIEEAYKKGVRQFVISESIDISTFENSTFIQVENTLWALQEISKNHRQKFNYPIVGITGSVGKTMVKEWIYHFLFSKFRVIRSPKSFNSQLGVALSLLELHENADIALIEMGISKPHEMKRLEEIVNPTYGIFTSFGSAHKENFQNAEKHLDEKLSAFKGCKSTFYHSSIELNSNQIEKIHGIEVHESNLNDIKSILPFQDKISIHNLSLVVAFAKFLNLSTDELKAKAKTLPHLAMRMEVFEGINGNTIINDTYNLDIDALNYSLEYQLTLAEDLKRLVIIGLDEEADNKKEAITKIIDSFKPEKTIYLKGNEPITEEIKNSIILIKGSRKADMQKIASQFRLKKHKTFLEVDLNALRNNLSVFKSYLKPETLLLAMVKASSYGSGTERVAGFLEKQGINYLGVAYADEGVELRKLGIQLPILVMNAEEEGFEDCIKYNLEPAIYSFEQLDEFVKELIFAGKMDYPIHLKVDTGMRRLGFEPSDLIQISEVLQAQPEVRIKSVYSHLADSDNFESEEFTLHQINTFYTFCDKLSQQINYPFIKHILNSEAIARFKDFQFDMVRLGIGMYGYTSNSELKSILQPVIFWKSEISQVKEIKKGETVGYSRTFIAEKDTKIAIIPVGYADGFKRSLSNGIGSVYLDNHFCPVIGRVCMDMLMIDVTNLDVKAGSKVEIIGLNKTMEEFANQAKTIPYEIMTSISKRVHRVYLEG
jgi:alanine racemase